MEIKLLKKYIAEANITKVFRELEEYFEQENPTPEIQNQFMVLNAQWNELTNNSLMYTTSETLVMKNKINNAMLLFIDQLETEEKQESKILPSDKIRILFLSANPIDTSKLQLDKEFVEIQKLIQASPESDKFELSIDTNITPNKLQQAVQKYKPNIFHFSGHGFGTGELSLESRSAGVPPALSGLIIEDERGNRKVLSQSALDGLFELIAEEANVEVVILNACFSAEQAATIKKHVKYVIGMTETILDKSAITFSTGFYRALANGRTIENAFKWGRNLIALEGLNEENKVIIV